MAGLNGVSQSIGLGNGWVNGLEPGNDPPPSTIASHLPLVSRQQSAAFDRDSFDQLLEVSLGNDENGQPNLRDDVVENRKLIDVILEAGLDQAAIDRHNPFQAQSLGRETFQAIRCIDVIHLAVERSPQVLYESGSTAQERPDTNRSPTFVRLILKLLPLLANTRSADDEVRPKACNLLLLCLSVDESCDRAGADCHAVRNLVQSYLDDIIDQLQAHGDVTASSDPILLNDGDGSFARQLSKLNLDGTSFAWPFKIGYKLDAFMVASDILSVLSQLTSSREFNVHSKIQCPFTAILRQLSSFWPLLCEIVENSTAPEEIGSSLTVQYFKTLKNLVRGGTSSLSTSSRRKLFVLWATSLGDLLASPGAVHDEFMEDALKSTVDVTSDTVYQDPEMYGTIMEILAPDLQRLFEVAPSTTVLKPGLRTAVTRLLAVSQDVQNGSESPTIGDLETWPDEGRARKRPRLSTDDPGPQEVSPQRTICLKLTQRLSGQSVPDLIGLSKTTVPHFCKMSDEDQSQALLLLGQAACALSAPIPKDLATNVLPECDFCDSYHSKSREHHLLTKEFELEIIKTLLATAPLINRSSKARVAAMLALQRVLTHSRSLDFLKLNQSSTGDWCLQSMKSSARDVRIAATQALRPFLRAHPSMDSTVVRNNRIIALDFLQSLWMRNEVTTQETAVLALTSIARIAGDEEMNIILVRLVEYLAHGNPYINGLVYAELQNLAEALQMSVATLINPYWRTVGVVVIKNIQSRPAVAQQLCDLLGWHIEGLLVRIEDYVLPYLVWMKKTDVINRIAAAHEPRSTTFSICTQRQALQNILSFLLTQAYPDPEETIMNLLLNVSEEFNEHDLATWLNLESTAVSCEVLKAIVDAAEGRGSRPHQALQFLAQAISRKTGHSSGTRKSDSVGIFFEEHALAITNQFIFTLNNAREPNMEKRRCLAAIGQVAKLGKSRILDALPQICACLRSSMESKDLCDASFASWVMMINGLKVVDVEPLIDQTLSIIVRSWDLFSTSTHQLAHDLVASLMKKHALLVREIFSTMPSLSSIPLLADVSSEVEDLKRNMDERYLFAAFTKRLANENLAVVEQALKELIGFLDEKDDFLQQSILLEQPDSYVADLIRSLLNCCVQFNESTLVTRLCGQALGHIGCVDPSKIETVQEKNSIVILSNFAKADETVDFIIFFLEHVLVKAFLSASSTRSQGFLGWAMQELLKLSNMDDAVALRSRSNGSNTTYRRWMDLPDNIRNTLTPFIGSRYVVQDIQPPAESRYPLYQTGRTSYLHWLRTLVLDLLHRAPGENPQLIFSICCRIISGQDAAIPSFLLPFAALNLVVSGIEEDKRQIVQEILNILRQPMEGDRKTQEDLRYCSERIFDILDYMFKWLQQKRKHCTAALARLERGVADPSFENAQAQIKNVEFVLESIPPDLMSKRAIDCKSYARALFNWENHIRQTEHKSDGVDGLLEHLQDIYAQIDEPDGIEGISSRLHVLNIEQQVLEHRKAGRWTAAQSWYEMQLVQDPEDAEIQVNLLQCLKESGQYDVLLHHFDGLDTGTSLSQVVPYAVEASWVTNRWDKLSTYLSRVSTKEGDFNLSVAFILRALHQDDMGHALVLVEKLEGTLATALTTNTTSSLQSSHDTLLKLHALHDVRLAAAANDENRQQVVNSLDKRLDILGSYVADKQYVLGLRKAAMELSPAFNKYDIASAWLASARLARKAQSSNQAFNAILHASALGEQSATIEQAKLMWQEGHHRKAIQTLEGAIESGAFVSHDYVSDEIPVTLTAQQQQYQNEVTAKAYALLGKWLDAAGQTQSDVIIKTFRKAVEHHKKWEKGHYYLGKYYNKIVDSERAKPPGKESQAFLNGEAAKLVIDNFLRSSSFGSKYVFQTLPKILTLWLELVAGSEQPQDARRGNEKFQVHTAAQRKTVVADTNKQMTKYAERLQPIVLYTILPQVVARICHNNSLVYNILVSIVVRVVRAFPQQSLWILLAVLKSQSKDRASRGLTIVSKACEKEKKTGRETSSAELRSMITAGQKFFDEILRVSDFPIEGKTSRVSLARDLGFNHKIAPSRLVVPVEACLIPCLPTNYEPATMKTFWPFSKEAVTINAFLDDALVLASLQKPRKLSIRGSDGQIYGALAKPKDDLRKDQRLMEFNTMINRFLKRDVEASTRRLYIRTYAVVPLNEECGLIEWVDNLKTFRDIVLKLYKEKNISPNYTEIRVLLDEASSGPPEKYSIFSNKILKSFPSLFHEWFVESFPDPSAWFNARLRYTRSCAVMSIVGHVLGLGDRHGENILFEEDNGGTLHVDFNCLFDKGLTFEKPEMVPFRLTHNMVDAFGAYGYNGPFRRCCEITLTLLRGNEDALMTILETFLHDPTTDFINSGKRKKAGVAGVPDTPMGVLDGVRGKVRGMLAGESVPLSVGGYVEEMIKRAVDEGNLCRMYIGWCAFF